MANLFRVDNQVAVVAGGIGGTGEAISYGLADYGAKVVVADTNLQKAERLKKLLASCPPGRIGQTSDEVGLCVFLACPASDYITGQIINLDGGLTAIS